MDNTTYSTMETLEHVAALLGVNLDTVQLPDVSLPDLSLPDLTLDDEDAASDGVQGQGPCNLSPR